MHYAKSFFDLQLHFASRVADLAGISFEKALMDYTNLYIRFGLGRQFDPEHPVWLNYIAALRTIEDPNECTYRFYLGRPDDVKPPGVGDSFGCFSYALDREHTIRIHFENIEPRESSPLGWDCVERRQSELRQLFMHIKSHHPNVLHVTGVSWLYNLPAYRRLFPGAYLATAKIAAPRFRNMPLWGQFLNRHGETRVDIAAAFIARLAKQINMEDLVLCFPFQPLEQKAMVSVFYEFYGV